MVVPVPLVTLPEIKVMLPAMFTLGLLVLRSMIPSVKVKVPFTSNAVVGLKVAVPPASLNTRLLKEEPPESMVEVPEAASKVTVLVPEVKVPPDLVQLPETVNVPLGAVKVPEDRVRFPLMSTLPEEPVRVPPDMVRPPLNVWAAVEVW